MSSPSSPRGESSWQEIVVRVIQQRQSGITLTDSQIKAEYPDHWPQVVEELAKLRQIDEAIDRAENEKLRRALESDGADSSSVRGEGASNGRSAGLDSGPVRHESGQKSKSVQPQRIGRFEVQQVLGAGGFGRVFLAWDDELTRHVAIKVPHSYRLKGADDVRIFLSEARLLAVLDHPAIVPVYDVGHTAGGGCYVVSKWIQGTNLAARMREERLSPSEAARIVCRVADALAYAHQCGIVHRDIKPANILLDHQDLPYVADFGLAVREEDLSRALTVAGTPSYMSPELARGEVHRIDGRSDLFSLGVVFYELLTGHRPFEASHGEQLFRQIIHGDVRPLRDWNPSVPEELERICLKSLAKRAVDRYATARQLSDDLRDFLADGGEYRVTANQVTEVPTNFLAQPASRVIPKGLRSFDANDAAFFLDLLPGPRDRDGLPESLRQWKSRIEQRDPDETFSVGLIYGPSGCGKSSFIRAGLLPRLASDVRTVYVEAAADDTEPRLLRRLGKKFPALAHERNLAHCLAQLRRGELLGPNGKLLLVIDQFEQWLHGRSEMGRRDLVEALRQCDGEHVQCLLLVRDDFWLGVSRFMGELEVQLVQGHNTALVDLFDVQHATRVLAEFGRAYSRLAIDPKEQGPAETAFLDRAVAGLCEGGRVISVRLALFAEMVKDRAWTLDTLQDVGGAEGLGVAFLEETFCARAANPQRRLHERAARAVLESLLPEAGSEIKGHTRSYPELLDVSGYGRNPRAFKELMRILDSETRLLTPTDPPVSDRQTGEWPTSDQPGRPAIPGVRYYQLTHDYLVPALRSWLTKKQLSTRSGRAELRLSERSRLWNARPEGRQLPSLWEWTTIRLLTRPDTWTYAQRRMMNVAVRRHATVIGTLASLVLAFVMLGTEATTLAKDLLVWFRATSAPIWLAFGREESIWPMLQRTEDPTLRTQLIHRFSSLLIEPEELVKRQVDERDVSIRRAMVLAAGQMGADPDAENGASLALRRTQASQELVSRLVELYQNDIDPGMHAAAEWALRRYKRQEDVDPIRLTSRRSPGDRQWYMTENGHTMVVIPGPAQYVMGSTAAERGLGEDEDPRAVHIRRSFSLSSKETTGEQFQSFWGEAFPTRALPGTPPDLRAPQAWLTWYQAAAYCNWLSRKEGIPETQWCYLPNTRGEYAAGMMPAPNASELAGYRLPTEAEWEYACRAGTTTPWYFGRSTTYSDEYLVGAARGRAHPLETARCKPNDFGLFDMLGNVAEWCHDRVSRSAATPESEPISDQDQHVVRGGSFRDLPASLRCAARTKSSSGQGSAEIGFRVARSYP